MERRKTFTRYIDSVSGEYLHPSVGRCDREGNCGYHYKPKDYFTDNNIAIPKSQAYANPGIHALRQSPPSFIPNTVFEKSLAEYEGNHFVQYLCTLFGQQITESLISKYYIGTSKHWRGATVFWQLDINGQARTGKIMLYNPVTGSRVKEPRSHITWAHKALQISNYNLRQCFFGEHLLRKDTCEPVAIVESEKTAVIAMGYFPQFIWLAAGSLNNLNSERCKILKGRQVCLFPDLNAFDKWSAKADELAHIATFQVSDLLELNATEAERQRGLDLADYLTCQDLSQFIFPREKHENVTAEIVFEPVRETKSNPVSPLTQATPKIVEQLDSYHRDISMLENYFSKIKISDQPLELNKNTKIVNMKLFLDRQFALVKNSTNKRIVEPPLGRLKELQKRLELYQP
jgi:hypothetical protein